MLGAEVRAGTFHFTWLSPTPTWQIVLGRWLGGSLVALVTIAPATRTGGRRRRRARGGRRRRTSPLRSAACRTSRLFIAIGCITRRTAVWSLAIVFLVERLLGAALTGIAQLSPTWESRAIFVGFLDDPPTRLIRAGIPQGGGAVVRLVIVTSSRWSSPIGGCRTCVCRAPPTEPLSSPTIEWARRDTSPATDIRGTVANQSHSNASLLTDDADLNAKVVEADTDVEVLRGRRPLVMTIEVVAEIEAAGGLDLLEHVAAGRRVDGRVGKPEQKGDLLAHAVCRHIEV